MVTDGFIISNLGFIIKYRIIDYLSLNIGTSEPTINNQQLIIIQCFNNEK